MENENYLPASLCPLKTSELLFFCVLVLRCWILTPALAAQWTKSFCNSEASGSIPGLERPPGEGMATHSSIPALKIHGQRGQVGCRPWSHSRVGKELVLTKLDVYDGRECVGGVFPVLYGLPGWSSNYIDLREIKSRKPTPLNFVQEGTSKTQDSRRDKAGGFVCVKI